MRSWLSLLDLRSSLRGAELAAALPRRRPSARVDERRKSAASSTRKRRLGGAAAGGDRGAQARKIAPSLDCASSPAP